MHALLPRLALVTVTLGTAAAAPQLPDRTPPTSYPRWEALGPLVGAGPEARALQQPALRPGELYASTTAGLVRSTDRGQTWSVHAEWPRRTGLVPRAAVSGADPNRIVLARFEGDVDVTFDGGATWRPPSVPPTATFLLGARFDPIDPATVLVFGTGGVWRSQDGGDTFALVADAAVYGGTYCEDVRFDPRNRLRIYAPVPGAGILLSEDGGDSWTVRPAPPGGSSSLTFAIDPSDGRRLLFAWDEVWVTEDGAQTWMQIRPDTGELFDASAFDPYDRDRILLGNRLVGILETTDGGLSWSDVADPGLDAMGGNPIDIAFSTAYPGDVIACGFGGFARSTDAGATWQRTNGGLDAYANVSDVAVDPFDPNHLVAKTGGSAFTSFDGGATWTESVSGAAFYGNEIVADAAVAGRYYTGGVGGSLWRSDDGGVTFSVVFTDPVVYFFHLESHPSLPNVVYGAGRGLRRSDDGGATFTNVGLPASWVWDVAVAPSDPDVIYANTATTVYSSRDGGATWTAATAPPAAIVRDLEVDPANPMRAWACTPFAGLFRTDDGGATWTLQPGSPELTNSAHVTAAAPSLLLTSDLTGWSAFSSRDRGATNVPLGRRLGSAITRFASSATQIYAATRGRGVMVLR